ncbi:histidine kinase [Pseudofrankia sp. BMG5.37]|uniref:sensor histidine kinase n=1 Tax=Pseudofrankia sp. BMG5.37 TaxID=3050035 RepID=UPI002894555F|nr:histidine kinase [Pseudofrankia sp. BMG5.37]MDT3445598.1 histidine kinase [Pseudofrankia sp. BMG5.37]
MTPLGERSAVAVGGLVVVAAAVTTVLLGDLGNGATAGVVGLALVALGAAVLVQVPGNRVGRAYVALAVVLVLAELATGSARPRVEADHGSWLRWLLPWSTLDWLAAFGVLTYVCFVFPDGAQSGGRWRVFRVVTLIAFPLYAAVRVISSRTLDSPLAAVPNPWAVALVVEPLTIVLLVVCGVGMLIAVGSLVVRTRRATGLERLQLRWLAAGLALAPALFVICVAVAVFNWPEWIISVGFVVLIAAVPLSTVVAIRRHGLWRIDRLISTTVAWSLSTGLVLGTYALVVVAIGGTTGRGSPWRVAAATLAAAAVARPTLRFLQRHVDRLFDRPRASALKVVEEFTAALERELVPPEQVGAVMARALGEPGLRVLYRLDQHWVDVLGGSLETPVDEPTTAVARDGSPLALLLHEREPQRPDVVNAVVRRCRLALEAVALRSDLRARVVEVEASRRRIVSAADSERRRIERDLHDGAQQRLVALGIGLRLKQETMTDVEDARRAFDQAIDGIGRSLQELRDLSQGLHAREVAEQGLTSALTALARRSPVPVAISGFSPRLPADVESTAWFVACEAITNASKHAQARQICLDLAHDGSTLRMVVRDDGRGGAAVADGTGLLGLLDRIAATSGTMTVESPVGVGTTITVELPCAS